MTPTTQLSNMSDKDSKIKIKEMRFEKIKNSFVDAIDDLTVKESLIKPEQSHDFFELETTISKPLKVNDYASKEDVLSEFSVKLQSPVSRAKEFIPISKRERKSSKWKKKLVQPFKREKIREAWWEEEVK